MQWWCWRGFVSFVFSQLALCEGRVSACSPMSVAYPAQSQRVAVPQMMLFQVNE